MLDEVALTDHAKDRANALSGGQESRVSLAAALVGAPEVLVLDEPTVGLDPVLRRDLWAIFRRLAGDGVTLLVSSHVMDEAVRCDRLMLMRAGALLADDTLDGVLTATGAGRREGVPRPGRPRRGTRRGTGAGRRIGDRSASRPAASGSTGSKGVRA